MALRCEVKGSKFGGEPLKCWTTKTDGLVSYKGATGMWMMIHQESGFCIALFRLRAEVEEFALRLKDIVDWEGSYEEILSVAEHTGDIVTKLRGEISTRDILRAEKKKIAKEAKKYAKVKEEQQARVGV